MRRESCEEAVRKLADAMERMRFDEYVRCTLDKRRLLRVNFLAGLARGFGAAVGFTVLGSLLVLLLRKIVELNLPGLGSFLAELTQIVLDRLK